MAGASPTTRARWQIHFCVVLWGFTPILGRLISIDASRLVWWRMLIVSATLLVVPRVWASLRSMPRRLIAAYAGIGALVAVHWVAFYASIRLANASVAVSCLALCPVFLAIVEPWITRTPHKPREFWLGLGVIPGVLLIAGGTPDSMNSGIVLGVLGAFFVAIAGACNKRLITHGDPLAVTWLEMTAGLALMTAIVPVLAGRDGFALPDTRDLILLLVLSLGCTLLPFVLSLVALRHLSAFSAQLAVNLEPVYAILLAMLLFGEHHELTLRFYAGVVIILGAVFVHPLLRSVRSHRAVPS